MKYFKSSCIIVSKEKNVTYLLWHAMISLLLNTGSLDNANQKFSLAQQHGLWAIIHDCTMHKHDDEVNHCNFPSVLTKLSWEDLYIFLGIFNKQLFLLHLLDDNEMIANSALWALLAIISYPTSTLGIVGNGLFIIL